MRFSFVFLAVFWLCIALEASLASWLPIFALPNIALLAVLSATLVLPPAHSLVLAFFLGLGADMLSGALFGAHAFALLIMWLLLTALAAQIQVRSWGALVALGAVATLVNAAVLAAASWFFLGGFALLWSDVGGTLLRAAVTGVCAPAVTGFTRFLERIFSELRARREMALKTRRPVL